MYCFSTKQPWAHVIMYLGKTVENRTWHAPAKVHGHRVLLHASKSGTEFCSTVFDFIQERIGRDLVHDYSIEYPRGAIVGSVVIVDSSRANRWDSDWFVGPIGWMLRDPWPLSEPIPCRGMPGFFIPKDFPTIDAEERCRELVKKLER